MFQKIKAFLKELSVKFHRVHYHIKDSPLVSYEYVLSPIDRQSTTPYYTEEDIQYWYGEGFSILEVAKLTNTSYYKTRNLLHKQGVVRKKGTRIISV